MSRPVPAGRVGNSCPAVTFDIRQHHIRDRQKILKLEISALPNETALLVVVQSVPEGVVSRAGSIDARQECSGAAPGPIKRDGRSIRSARDTKSRRIAGSGVIYDVVRNSGPKWSRWRVRVIEEHHRGNAAQILHLSPTDRYRDSIPSSPTEICNVAEPCGVERSIGGIVNFNHRFHRSTVQKLQRVSCKQIRARAHVQSVAKTLEEPILQSSRVDDIRGG